MFGMEFPLQSLFRWGGGAKLYSMKIVVVKCILIAHARTQHRLNAASIVGGAAVSTSTQIQTNRLKSFGAVCSVENPFVFLSLPIRLHVSTKTIAHSTTV